MSDVAHGDLVQQTTDEPELHVGDRIQVGRDRATVLYVGPVSNQDGTWVGVEWDDASRGKHDGTTGGVQYFTVKGGATAGSFLRREKVPAGRSVLYALVARYNNQQSEYGEDASQEEMYVWTLRHHKVPINMIGADQVALFQRQTQRLTAARLVGAGISHVGDAAALRQVGPSIRELDLTCNLITDWSCVGEVARGLPNLQALNLSNNALRLQPAPQPVPALQQLRVLVLNNCGITWQQVLAVAPEVPNLEELHLRANGIVSLAPVGDDGAPSASRSAGSLVQVGDDAPSASPSASGRTAEAEGGTTTSSGRTATGAAGGADTEGGPEDAADARAGRAGGTGGAQRVSGFQKLQVLDLEDNGLSEWREVKRLSQLPSLAKLHLSNNPLSDVHYPPTTAGPAGPATLDGSSAAAAAAAPAAEAATAAAATPISGATPSPPSSSSSPSSSPGPTAPFAALRSLFLGGCRLATWKAVDHLDQFPVLTELRVSGNPVLAAYKTGGRYEVIARISRLLMLNGADVKPRERQDSELRYLQHVAGELGVGWADHEATRAAVHERHPRLPALLQRHGQVLGTAAKANDHGNTLAASLFELKLTCVATSAGAKMGTQVKKLPRSTTLGALRQLCEKLFRVPASHQALSLRTAWDPAAQELPSDDDARQLVAMGIQSGYEVLVDEFDPDQRSRADQEAQQAQAAELATRAAEQLKQGDMLIGEFARSIGLPGGAPAGVTVTRSGGGGGGGEPYIQCMVKGAQ